MIRKRKPLWVNPKAETDTTLINRQVNRQTAKSQFHMPEIDPDEDMKDYDRLSKDQRAAVRDAPVKIPAKMVQQLPAKQIKQGTNQMTSMMTADHYGSDHPDIGRDHYSVDNLVKRSFDRITKRKVV